MTQTDSSMQQVIDRCRAARFTGIVRIHAKQGEGELWFLSGVTDESKFGVSVGDEAMARILGLADAKVELVPRLPNEAGAMKKGLPIEGSLGPLRPLDLFRLCEMHALTCTLELQSKTHLGEARYEMGELLSVECDEGTDRSVAEMLQWTEGTYKFVLPAVELPPGITPWVSASLAQAAPESIPPPAVKPTPEADAKAKAEEDKIRRKAEELAAKRKAEEADARRKAAEAAEAKRKAEEAEKRTGAEAEAKRKAAERIAAEAAAAKRKADALEMKRRAEVVKRKADEAAEAKRSAPEKPTGAAAVAKAKSEPPRPESKPPGPAVVVQKIVEVVASPSQRPPRVESQPPPRVEKKAAPRPAAAKRAEEPVAEAAPSPSPPPASVPPAKAKKEAKEEEAPRELPGLVPEEEENEDADRVSEPVPLSRRSKKKGERPKRSSERPPAKQPAPVEEEDEAPIVPAKKGPSMTTILLFLAAIAAAVYWFYLRRK